MKSIFLILSFVYSFNSYAEDKIIQKNRSLVSIVNSFSTWDDFIKTNKLFGFITESDAKEIQLILDQSDWKFAKLPEATVKGNKVDFGAGIKLVFDDGRIQTEKGRVINFNKNMKVIDAFNYILKLDHKTKETSLINLFIPQAHAYLPEDVYRFKRMMFALQDHIVGGAGEMFLGISGALGLVSSSIYELFSFLINYGVNGIVECNKDKFEVKSTNKVQNPFEIWNEKNSGSSFAGTATQFCSKLDSDKNFSEKFMTGNYNVSCKAIFTSFRFFFNSIDNLQGAFLLKDDFLKKEFKLSSQKCTAEIAKDLTRKYRGKFVEEIENIKAGKESSEVYRASGVK